MKRGTPPPKSGKVVRSSRTVQPGRSLSSGGRDKRLSAMGFGPVVFSPGLTSYQRTDLEKVPLPELLVRGLAVGDDDPVEGVIRTVAKEMGAFASLEEASQLGDLLYHWTARLHIAAELARRYREVRP